MNKIIYILSLTLMLSACSNSVRFTSNTNNNTNNSNKSNNKKSNSKISHNNYKIENNSISEQISDYANNWIGVPYKYGGTNSNGVDCSGFIKNVFNQYGYDLPRTAQQQYDFARKVSKNNAKQGDLVFFRRRGKIFHVGLYLGDNKIIHASTSKGVIIQDLSNDWLNANFYSFGRISDDLHSSR